MIHRLAIPTAFVLSGLVLGACASAPEMIDDPDSGGMVRTYDETDAGIPVIADYPASMRVEAAGSGEGVGVFFTSDEENRPAGEFRIHVFLPAGAATAADIEPFVTGARGLMESNGWTAGDGDGGGTGEYSLPWLRSVIPFTAEGGRCGRILLGQTEGQAVRVTLLYPCASSAAYRARAELVLDSLRFDRALLPITGSGL